MSHFLDLLKRTANDQPSVKYYGISLWRAWAFVCFALCLIAFMANDSLQDKLNQGFLPLIFSLAGIASGEQGRRI